MIWIESAEFYDWRVFIWFDFIWSNVKLTWACCELLLKINAWFDFFRNRLEFDFFFSIRNRLKLAADMFVFYVSLWILGKAKPANPSIVLVCAVNANQSLELIIFILIQNNRKWTHNKMKQITYPCGNNLYNPRSSRSWMNSEIFVIWLEILFASAVRPSFLAWSNDLNKSSFSTLMRSTWKVKSLFHCLAPCTTPHIHG